VAQRVGRGIALLFHDRGTRRVSSTPRPHFTPGKDPVLIVQETGWAPGPVWTGAENLVPKGIRSRTVQPVAQSLYRLSYRAHVILALKRKITLLTEDYHIFSSGTHFLFIFLWLLLYSCNGKQIPSVNRVW